MLVSMTRFQYFASWLFKLRMLTVAEHAPLRPARLPECHVALGIEKLGTHLGFGRAETHHVEGGLCMLCRGLVVVVFIHGWLSLSGVIPSIQESFQSSANRGYLRKPGSHLLGRVKQNRTNAIDVDSFIATDKGRLKALAVVYLHSNPDSWGKILKYSGEKLGVAMHGWGSWSLPWWFGMAVDNKHIVRSVWGGKWSTTTSATPD